jgi:NAD(P)H-flavin reductase
VSAAGTSVRLVVHAAGAAGQRVEIVRNGDVVATLPVETSDQELAYTLTLRPGQWVHVRMRDGQGITAFTNPVYARAANREGLRDTMPDRG